MTAPRTSSDAASTTSGTLAGRAARSFSRKRRRMFSTSTIASSTTSPIAMASPPSDIVFKLTPSFTSTMTADSSERGIAASETAAARRLRSIVTRTAITSALPIASVLRKFPSERSTKFAGRCSAGWRVTRSRAKTSRRSARAASTRRVTSTVLAP